MTHLPGSLPGHPKATSSSGVHAADARLWAVLTSVDPAERMPHCRCGHMGSTPIQRTWREEPGTHRAAAFGSGSSTVEHPPGKPHAAGSEPEATNFGGSVRVAGGVPRVVGDLGLHDDESLGSSDSGASGHPFLTPAQWIGPRTPTPRCCVRIAGRGPRTSRYRLTVGHQILSLDAGVRLPLAVLIGSTIGGAARC